MLLYFGAKECAHAPIAQLDRVTDYESVGRGFESLSAYQKSRYPFWDICFSYLQRKGLEPSKSQYAGGILLPPVQTLVATLISAQRAEMQTSPFGVTPHLTLPLMGQPSPFVIFAPHLI